MLGTIEELESVLVKLFSLKEPDRNTDYDIARFLGWTQKKGENGVVWSPPGVDEIHRVPRYTKYLDEAYHLTESLMQKSAVAVTWQRNTANAVIDDGPVSTAVNPSIAVCIAALRMKRVQLLNQRNGSARV